MPTASRRTLLAATVLALGLGGCSAAPEVPEAAAPAASAAPTAADATVVVRKSPDCTCCAGHVAHLEAFGLPVEVIEDPDVAAFKDASGVPVEARSCHTAEVGGYVVEGHVPAAAIRYLLATQPNVDGIALPGMPAGAPGMDGPPEPLTVVTIDDGAVVGELGTY